MKSFARLVKNEIAKIFAQTSYRVLFIIMIALFILIPLLSKGLEWLIGYSDSQDRIEYSLEFYEEEIKGTNDPLVKEYYQINLDVNRFFKNCGLDSTSWQYKSMHQDYLDYTLSEYIFGKLYSGEISLEKANESPFAHYVELSKIENVETEKETIKLFYEECSKQKKEYEGLIKDSKITDLYQKQYDDLTKYIGDYKQQINHLKLENVYKKSDTIEYQIVVFEKTIVICEISRCIYDLAIKNAYEYDSWQYNSAITSFRLAYETSTMEAPLSEEEFVNGGLSKDYEDYNAYVEEWKNEINKRVDSAKALQFSVENGIPTQAMQKSSAKGVFLTTVTSNIQYIIYFTVVLAALIIANEFSSGSARLLFIRPHSRNKILMSKYTAILLLVIALNLVNILFSFIFTVIFNGVGDIFTSNITVVDGIAKKSSMLLHLLGTVALANFRLIFIATFTFMISTLLKRSALGIILGIVGDAIFSTITGIVSVASSTKVVKFIPFSYYQAEIFAVNKVEGLLLNYTQNVNVSSMVNSIYYAYANNLNVWGAVGNFVFWVALCLTITLVLFRKQEIKN